MIEKDSKENERMTIRSIITLILTTQCVIHLEANWDRYDCGANMNGLMLVIYLLHYIRIGLKIVTWQPQQRKLSAMLRAFVNLLILAWSCFAIFWLGSNGEDLTQYPTCATLCIGVSFIVFGFLVTFKAIYDRFIKTPQHNYQPMLSENLTSQTSDF